MCDNLNIIDTRLCTSDNQYTVYCRSFKNVLHRDFHPLLVAVQCTARNNRRVLLYSIKDSLDHNYSYSLALLITEGLRVVFVIVYDVVLCV